jgi:hypothetical protein
LADKRRLAREIDMALHGEEGAAKQAFLCDLVEPARRLRKRAARFQQEHNEAYERAAENARGIYMKCLHESSDQNRTSLQRRVSSAQALSNIEQAIRQLASGP